MPKNIPAGEATDFDGNAIEDAFPGTTEVVERPQRSEVEQARASQRQLAEEAVYTFDDIAGSAVSVSPWRLVEDKGDLKGVPLVVVAWEFRTGDLGEFVSCFAMTKEGERVVFNDGSTGIREQIHKHEEKNGLAPILCVNGLRASEYETEVKGRMIPATTYYLS